MYLIGNQHLEAKFGVPEDVVGDRVALVTHVICEQGCMALPLIPDRHAILAFGNTIFFIQGVSAYLGAAEQPFLAQFFFRGCRNFHAVIVDCDRRAAGWAAEHTIPLIQRLT